MSEKNYWISRVVAWSGKAALYCLGLFATLALIVLAAVLAPVMLTATVIPSARRVKGEIRRTGGTAGTPRSVHHDAGLGFPEGAYAGADNGR